jgi:TonB family protein
MLAGCASPPPGKIATDSEPPKIRIGETLSCNQVVHQVRPVYPAEAKRRHIEGTVTLRVVITRTGEIRDVEVLKGDPLLIPPALSAVKRWRYAPCIINSEPVELRTSLDINFNLSQ